MRSLRPRSGLARTSDTTGNYPSHSIQKDVRLFLTRTMKVLRSHMDMDIVYSMGDVSKYMRKISRYVSKDCSVLRHALKETKGRWKAAHLVLRCHRPLEPELYMNLLGCNLWWFPWGRQGCFSLRRTRASVLMFISKLTPFPTTSSSTSASWIGSDERGWMWNFRVQIECKRREPWP